MAVTPYENNPTFSSEEVAELESKLLTLLHFYTPEPQHKAHINVLKRFMASFEEHTTDNLKILLELLISGHQEKMAQFISLLQMLPLKNETGVTVGEFLENVAPLLRNKAFLMITHKALEKTEKMNLVTYLQAIPHYLNALEDHREQTLAEMMGAETIVNMILRYCQLNLIKNKLDPETLAALESHSQPGKLMFLSHFNDLSMPNFLHLTKVLAHPTFCDFLKSLPQDATFETLNQWLASPSEQVPLEVQEPFCALQHYQQNHERIAEDTHRQLVSMKERFTLSKGTLHAHLNRLHHAPAPPKKPLKSRPQLIGGSFSRS